jgi:two-component system, NarL family, sensor histidine kinase DevS
MVVLTREQLEERLAALHQASLELVGNLSLDVVLERIVQMAREQVNARYAALGVVDDQGDLMRFIPVGMEPDVIGEIPHQPQGEGLLGLFRSERCTIRVPEILEDPRSVGFPPHHPKMHSFLGVPILQGERHLGQLYLTDKQDYPIFTENDERVIEALAAYAAIAITNARLYENLVQRDNQLTQRNQDLRLINDIAAALSSTLDLQNILDQTLSHVIDYLKVEAGEIFLKEDGEKVLRLALHRGDSAEAFWKRNTFAIGEGAVGMVAESGKPLVNLNPKTDLRYLRQSVARAGYECIAVIPLIAHASVVGVMSIATRQTRHMTDREVQLMLAIGAWAGTTIENARLHQQARRLAILEERERIGMDLHDGIIQSIYGVGLALDYARMELEGNPDRAREKLGQSIEALNKTIRDIRTYILDLRPRQLHSEDLRQGLQRLAEEFQINSGGTATLVTPENGLVDFPAQNATALFHICQEALANVAKHSNAKHAEIHLWTTKGRVLLEISDDGQGFDTRGMKTVLGHGLANMQTRARKAGGDVEITSFPGEGTSVLAWVPKKA